MLAWRTALAPRSADFLLTALPRSGAEALDKSGFPLVAHRMALVGRVFVEQDVDASGKVISAFVQRRALHAASLGKQEPVGLEHELDQATLDRVAAMVPKAPDPASLSNGVATRRVGIEWVVK
jgi:outer membrane biosynthesis protein TonB